MLWKGWWGQQQMFSCQQYYLPFQCSKFVSKTKKTENIVSVHLCAFVPQDEKCVSSLQLVMICTCVCENVFVWCDNFCIFCEAWRSVCVCVCGFFFCLFVLRAFRTRCWFCFFTFAQFLGCCCCLCVLLFLPFVNSLFHLFAFFFYLENANFFPISFFIFFYQIIKIKKK